MDIQILEYFIEIAKENSITKAAENLFISQPALSQRLRQLEKEIGTQLFLRDGNKMKLTEAGILFLNGAQSAVYIKEKAYQQLAEFRKNPKEQPK